MKKLTNVRVFLAQRRSTSQGIRLLMRKCVIMSEQILAVVLRMCTLVAVVALVRLPDGRVAKRLILKTVGKIGSTQNLAPGLKPGASIFTA